MNGTSGLDKHLTVNPIDCAGHGACAELLPELISLDEWGYPLLDPRPVPLAMERQARKAVNACPALALHLTRRTDAGARPTPPARAR